MTKKIGVLLIDDHALFRRGVKALLSRQPDIEVVGEAADGLEGIKRCTQLRPDLVLLDLNLPGLSGRDTLALLLEEHPSLPVIMLTVSEESSDLMDCLQRGAEGYLLKNIEIDQLIDGIRRAVRGEAVMSPQMTGKLVEGIRHSTASVIAPQAEHEKLSPREREILAFIARGASNKEIARALDLAESTVKIHVQHILRKLNLSSRVQAAVYAVEQGLAAKDRA